MTLYDKLKKIEGRVVTIRSHFMGQVFEETGTLEVHKPVYPHQAGLTLKGKMGAYNANHGTVIGEGAKTIISVRN